MAHIVIAHLPDCRDGDCPKLYLDTETDMVGVQGATEPGGDKEHISWMSRDDFRCLVGQLPA